MISCNFGIRYRLTTWQFFIKMTSLYTVFVHYRCAIKKYLNTKFKCKYSKLNSNQLYFRISWIHTLYHSSNIPDRKSFTFYLSKSQHFPSIDFCKYILITISVILIYYLCEFLSFLFFGRKTRWILYIMPFLVVTILVLRRCTNIHQQLS